MKLSILIPTTPDRKHFLLKILAQFGDQLTISTLKLIEMSSTHLIERYIYQEEVEVIIFRDEKQFSIGRKRNRLLSEARGEYIAFVDDDDRIGENYFKLLFEGIEKGVDCCSLKGIITENGVNPLVFEHSIKYKEYKTNPDGASIKYERFPNHLNTIRSWIAKQFQFPEINHSEDTAWATLIKKSGLIKIEHYINDTLYYYDYRSRK